MIVLRIYEGRAPGPVVDSVKDSAILQRHDLVFVVTMTKVSWSCIEISCCIPNCTAPCFHPKISHVISHGLPSPLSPFSPISSCTSRPANKSGDMPPSSCCGKVHKHFLYSIVLPTSSHTDDSSTRSALQSPERTTPSSASTPYTAPIVTPTTPPERPSLRARRNTLTKLKIPESPPLSSPLPVPQAQVQSPQVQFPPVRPPSRNHNNRSAGPSLYPDMFLPMPSQMQTGSGSRQVSPLSTTYSPFMNRDFLAMSPISPLVPSNNPSPIMGAA